VAARLARLLLDQSGGVCMSDVKATSAAPIVDEQQRGDSERLQQLGYRQELRRSMSGF
jgi:hypothetical protein